MHRWKEGKLHVGTSDKIVTTQKQAVAIALNQSGLSNSKKAKPRKDADDVPKFTLKQRISITLKQIISSVYRDGVDAVLNYAMSDNETISGLFRDGSEVYDFSISKDGRISYVEADKKRKDAYLEGYYLTEYVPLTGATSDYTQGVLQSQLTKLDAAKPRQCSTGKSCGSTCISKGMKCVQGLGVKQKVALGNVQKVLSDKNNQQNAALAGAGLLAAAALAGGAVALSKRSGGKSEGREPRTKETFPAAKTTTPASSSRATPQPTRAASPSKTSQQPDIDDPWNGAEPQPRQNKISAKTATPQSKTQLALPPGTIRQAPPVVAPKPKVQPQTEPILRESTASEAAAAKNTLLNKNTGNNIAQALEIKGFDSDMSSKLGHIANQINKTVNIPNLPKIPVQPPTDSDSNADGGYFSATCTDGKTGEFLGRVPLKIEIDPKGNRPESSLVHETGHFIHHAAIGDPKEGYKGKIKPEMQELFNAMSRTKAIKNIDRLARTARNQDVRERANYLNQPEEIFARMFTQYTAKKSGSKVLQAQIKAGQKGKAVEYWDDREFNQIVEPAMDKFAKEKGWR